ncbi:MAG: cytochrome c3 family protein [Oligoflexales bacterium]
MHLNFSRLFIVFMCLNLWNCRNDAGPQVTDQNFQSPSIDHEKFTLDCSECHEHERLASANDVKHGFGRECSECHKYEVDNKWDPLSHKHIVDDEREPCLGCHGLDRPDRESHTADGDCLSCHAYPAWSPPNFL